MTKETVTEEKVAIPDVDPQVARLANYMENLNKEIDTLQQELLKVQYALDIRITAKNAYTNAMQQESQANGKDKEENYKEKDLGDGLTKLVKEDESDG